MINTRTKIANWLESATTTTTDATAVHESIHELAKREDINLSSITSYQEVLEALSDTAMLVVNDIAESHGLGKDIKYDINDDTNISELINKVQVATTEVYPETKGKLKTKSDGKEIYTEIGDRTYSVLDLKTGILQFIGESKMKESLAKKLLNKTSNINESSDKEYVVVDTNDPHSDSYESGSKEQCNSWIKTQANRFPKADFLTITLEDFESDDPWESKISESVKTSNKKDGNKIVTDVISGSNTARFIHSGADSIDDAKNWIEGEDISSIEDFIGFCLHTIQQVGGELYVNDKQVEAANHNQTSGKPVKLNDLKFIGESKMKESLSKQLLNKTVNVNESKVEESVLKFTDYKIGDKVIEDVPLGQRGNLGPRGTVLYVIDIKKYDGSIGIDTDPKADPKTIVYGEYDDFIKIIEK